MVTRRKLVGLVVGAAVVVNGRVARRAVRRVVGCILMVFCLFVPRVVWVRIVGKRGWSIWWMAKGAARVYLYREEMIYNRM